MSVPLTLLGLLEREPSHGYDLKRDYDTYFGRSKPLPFGQVYATLARLSRDGKWLLGSRARRRAGSQALRHHPGGESRSSKPGSANPSNPNPTSRPSLFAKVVLALMLGRSAEQYLDTQRAAHLQRMRELTELKRQDNLIDALLADHGLFHLEADLRWIDMTAARLPALAAAVAS
jgi:hypothetical protein